MNKAHQYMTGHLGKKGQVQVTIDRFLLAVALGPLALSSPSAAVLDGTKAKTVVMPLPGSTGGNVLTYNGVSTSGNTVTIDATPYGYVAGKTDALTKAFDDNEFQ